MYTTDALRCHDPFHFYLLSFFLTASGKWKNLNESPIRQDCDIGNRFCKHHKWLSLSQPFCWYTWGTEIDFIHRVLIGFNLGNQGFLASQSGSRVLISITHTSYNRVRVFSARVYGKSAKCAGKTRLFNLQYGPRKMKLLMSLLYLLIQIEGKKISVQAERPVMINERQILSTRTFYWLPIKTGLWGQKFKIFFYYP